MSTQLLLFGFGGHWNKGANKFFPQARLLNFKPLLAFLAIVFFVRL